MPFFGKKCPFLLILDAAIIVKIRPLKVKKDLPHPLPDGPGGKMTKNGIKPKNVPKYLTQ